MATRDTGQGVGGISRRDFLKASAAATAVVGCGLEFAYNPAKAQAYEGDPAHYKITTTTCPYCSASCGQRVVVDKRDGSPTLDKVIDIYGDFESPMNSGGLCAKGAGSLQLANNPRRIGAYTGSHPVNPVFAADGTTNGVAYKRTGDGAWATMSLDSALSEIAPALKAARDSHAALWDPTTMKYNSQGVAFFGCSHMNNESNYMYRKLIANFGSSNVEHQARI